MSPRNQERLAIIAFWFLALASFAIIILANL